MGDQPTRVKWKEMDGLADRLRLLKLGVLCKKYDVLRLSVFGSALREDFNEESDFDFVVEFGTSERYSLSSQFFGFAHELEFVYQLKVDLIERKGVRNP